jgi:NADH/NAD ratio-sensing transcriptional regulator Rex
MINLIRGKVDNKIDNTMIDELVDLVFLVKDNKIEINTKTLTIKTAQRVTDFASKKDVELSFYFEQ